MRSSSVLLAVALGFLLAAAWSPLSAEEPRDRMPAQPQTAVEVFDFLEQEYGVEVAKSIGTIYASLTYILRERGDAVQRVQNANNFIAAMQDLYGRNDFQERLARIPSVQGMTLQQVERRLTTEHSAETYAHIHFTLHSLAAIVDVHHGLLFKFAGANNTLYAVNDLFGVVAKSRGGFRPISALTGRYDFERLYGTTLNMAPAQTTAAFTAILVNTLEYRDEQVAAVFEMATHAFTISNGFAPVVERVIAAVNLVASLDALAFDRPSITGLDSARPQVERMTVPVSAQGGR